MMLLFPCFQTLEQGDDNLFHIYVNDSLVGTLGDADRAETCFKEARRQAASTQDGLLLADVEAGVPVAVRRTDCEPAVWAIGADDVEMADEVMDFHSRLG